MLTPDAPTFQTLRRVPLATIDALVSARLGTTRVKGNAQPAVFNRQIAMYLAKHVGGWSTTAIGKFYNGRHHTTVLWALHRIECLRARHARIEALVFSLAQEIQSRHILKQPECGTGLSSVTERHL
jgi:chromosomal replication initiator protein